MPHRKREFPPPYPYALLLRADSACCWTWKRMLARTVCVWPLNGVQRWKRGDAVYPRRYAGSLN